MFTTIGVSILISANLAGFICHFATPIYAALVAAASQAIALSLCEWKGSMIEIVVAALVATLGSIGRTYAENSHVTVSEKIASDSEKRLPRRYLKLDALISLAIEAITIIFSRVYAAMSGNGSGWNPVFESAIASGMISTLGMLATLASATLYGRWTTDDKKMPVPLVGMCSIWAVVLSASGGSFLLAHIGIRSTLIFAVALLVYEMIGAFVLMLLS
jgi:hypothetical protein